MSAMNPSQSENRAVNIDRIVELQRTDVTSGTHVLQLLKNARLLSFTSHASANTEFQVAHGLTDEAGNKVIPLGVLQISSDKAAELYPGTTAWDEDNIYLKASASSAAMKIIVHEGGLPTDEAESSS